MEHLDVFVSSFVSFWDEFARFLPRLLIALVLLFVGWLLAKLARTGVLRLLGLLRFDRVTERSGLEAFLKQADLDISLAGIMSSLIYWLIILVMIVTVAQMQSGRRLMAAEG